MIAAIPLFGREVAPRFCFATEVLILDASPGQVTAKGRLVLAGLPWVERLRLLDHEGVELLLCDGFNRLLLPLAQGFGIQVIWGLSGEADEVVTKLRSGQLLPSPPAEGE